MKPTQTQTNIEWFIWELLVWPRHKLRRAIKQNWQISGEPLAQSFEIEVISFFSNWICHLLQYSTQSWKLNLAQISSRHSPLNWGIPEHYLHEYLFTQKKTRVEWCKEMVKKLCRKRIAAAVVTHAFHFLFAAARCNSMLLMRQYCIVWHLSFNITL